LSLIRGAELQLSLIVMSLARQAFVRFQKRRPQRVITN